MFDYKKIIPGFFYGSIGAIIDISAVNGLALLMISMGKSGAIISLVSFVGCCVSLMHSYKG